MSDRARNGERFFRWGGKSYLFILRSVHDNKARAQKIAEKVRAGNAACACCGAAQGGKHYARVVRHNWHDVGNLNRWAIYTFPKEN